MVNLNKIFAEATRGQSNLGCSALEKSMAIRQWVLAQQQGNLALKEEPVETVVANDHGIVSEYLNEIPSEDVLKDFTLPEEEIVRLKQNYANDNFSWLPTDPTKMVNDREKINEFIQNELFFLKFCPLSEEERLKRFRKLQILAAKNLMAEYMVGQDLKAISGCRGLKSASKLRKKDGKKTKKEIIAEKYPHLTPRLIRDFQNLEYECVVMAIQVAFEREDTVTRSMALSGGIKKLVVNKPKALPSSLKRYYPTKGDYGNPTGVFDTEEPIYACSLFANIGIGTSLLEKETNIKVVVANEYVDRRAKVHRRLYPDCEVIQGDIANPEIFDRVMAASKTKGCKVCFASPPCDQASQQNTSESKGKKPEARLFKEVIDAAKLGIFDCFVVENVPQWPDSKPEIAADILNGKTIGEYMIEGFDVAGYYAKIYIIDAADYGTAEARQRCFILARKKDLPEWKVPEKDTFRLTVYEAIGHLRSLGNGEVDPNLKWHYALPLTDEEIKFIAHTETGNSAWNNPAKYTPRNKDGSAAGAQISQTYTRIDPSRPIGTITSDSGNIGGIKTLHYGRPLTDGTYSDCRVLSILELLRLMGAEDTFLDPLDAPAKKLPNGEVDKEDFDGLNWEKGRLTPADERFIRDALGEHVCPRLLVKLMSTMPVRPKTTAKKGGVK